MRRAVWGLAVWLAAAGAEAQDAPGARGGQPPGPAVQEVPAAPPASGSTLADACAAALRGELPADADRDALLSRCDALLRSAAAAQAATATAGEGRDPARPGQSVLAAFGQAGNELFGRPAPGAPKGMGMRYGGAVRNTLTTNPIGWFDGAGMNLEYTRSVRRKFAWSLGGRYSSTDATNGAVRAFGGAGGVDVYLIGQHNEGLRFGPRLSFDVGRETFQNETTFGRMGGAAELGYSFIATNGVTFQLAGGWSTRLLGDENEAFSNSFTGPDSGPYGRLNLGYSW